MRQYKGYYIDNVIFNNTNDIEAFLKRQAVDAYKMAVTLFVERSTIENSIYCDEKAERLVNEFGFTWEQVTALEIETMKSIA